MAAMSQKEMDLLLDPVNMASRLRQAAIAPFADRIRQLLIAAGHKEGDQRQEVVGFDLSNITPIAFAEGDYVQVTHLDWPNADCVTPVRAYYQSLMDQGLDMEYHEPIITKYPPSIKIYFVRDPEFARWGGPADIHNEARP